MVDSNVQKGGDAEGAARQKTTAVKSTQTANEAYKVVKAMYARGLEARQQGAPVAWVMTACMAETLLKAMGIVAVYTENYSSVCAAKKVAQPFIALAEAEGYSRDICGYVTTGIGYAIRQKELGMTPPEAPEGGLASPNMLIGGSMVCDPRIKWYQALARYMDVPYFSLDWTPPPVGVDVDAVRPYYVEYLVQGLRRFVAFLEKHTGKKMDYDKLTEVIRISEETRRMWWKCLEMGRNIPAPAPTEDMLSCCVPGMYDAADRNALAFYHKLYDELKYRVDNKIGVIPEEKYRLLFVGLPPWHNMNLFNYFESLGAVSVIQINYNPFEPYEGGETHSDPLERLATSAWYSGTRKYCEAAKGCGHPLAQRILDWVKEFSVDGIVMHGVITCRARTIGQRFYKNVIMDHVKVPIVFLESDMIDERSYSEEQMRGNIDAFMETLAASKKN